MECRAKCLELLVSITSPQQARLDFAEYMILFIRCLLAKPWPLEHQTRFSRISTGKFTNEKATEIGILWAKWVDEKYPNAQFAIAAGLLATEGSVALEDSQEIDLKGFSLLKRRPSDETSNSPSQFKRGDLVTVIRRMTWNVPIKGSKDYRKDVVEGTQGTIEGWADVEKRKVLVKCKLCIGGEDIELVQDVYPRNLQLTSEHQLMNAARSAEAAPSSASVSSSASGSSSTSGASPFQWLLQNSEPSCVKMQEKLHNHLADTDALNTSFWLKSRIGVALQSLYESLTAYTDKDLVVCHRQNKHGAWRCELWTKRDFAPRELVFAPLSSQLKDSRVTNVAHVVVGVPLHGPGAHPEGGSIALDGRTRTSIAQAGLLDPVEHTGSLFGVVHRSSEIDEANMVIDQVSWEHKVTLSMPFKKAKHTVQWQQQDLPTIPVLLNPKAIKARQRLVVYHAIPKTDIVFPDKKK